MALRRLGGELYTSSFAIIWSVERRSETRPKYCLKTENDKEGSIVWLSLHFGSASRRRNGFVDRPEMLHSDMCKK